MAVLFSSIPLRGKSSPGLISKWGKINKVVGGNVNPQGSDLPWLSVTLLTRPLAHLSVPFLKVWVQGLKDLSATKISTQATLRSRSSYGRRDSLSAIVHGPRTWRSPRFPCTSSWPITHASVKTDGARSGLGTVAKSIHVIPCLSTTPGEADRRYWTRGIEAASRKRVTRSAFKG